MTTPCIVIATFTPVEGKTEDVIAVLEDVIPDVHREEGCELYALHQEVTGHLVLVEKWTSRELWQIHSGADTVTRIQGGLAGLLEGEADVREMYSHAVGEKTHGAL
jgi:quinol monooxygenase YgiN